MKLVLYSSGYDEDNRHIDDRLKKLIAKNDPQITFIPSSSYLSFEEYGQFVEYYKRYNWKRFLHFPIDIDYSETLKKEAFQSDVIHLGGGNTFYFLKHLRKKKLLQELKNFVSRGGILTGISAGAILMTEHIETAGFPTFDRDDNEDNMKNLNSLKLTNFEFFPHYKKSQRYDTELINYSKTSKNPIYALSDGSGIIVDNGSIQFLGRCHAFVNGQKFLLS